MIYPERDSKSLEFKSKMVSLNMLIKTCVAFANGIGGEIIIGVEDRTRQIVGIDEVMREQIYEKFPNSLYDSTQPSLFPQIYEKKMGAQSGLKKPVYSENGDFVKITFYFLPAASRDGSQNELIMAQFKFNSELTIDDITKSLNISRNTATRYLNKLIKQGKILRKGKGPAVRYVMLGQLT